MLITYQDQLILGPANFKQLMAKMTSTRLQFNQQLVGELWTLAGHLPDEHIQQQMAACLQLVPHLGLNAAADFFAIRRWLLSLQQRYSAIVDWAGIYFKESYLYSRPSELLILGPFVGERTDHWRIGINNGLCGLAIRENRVVNAPDVNADQRHIACSLKTKSELVIPLYSTDGEVVAEVDLDSNTLNAFNAAIEEEIKRALEVWRLPAKIGQ